MGDDYLERQASAGGQQVNAQRHPKIVGIEEVGLGTFFLLLLFLLLNESNGASSVVTLALMLAIVGATFILLGFMTLWRTTDSIQKRSAPEAQQGGFPAPMNATEPVLGFCQFARSGGRDPPSGCPSAEAGAVEISAMP